MRWYIFPSLENFLNAKRYMFCTIKQRPKFHTKATGRETEPDPTIYYLKKTFVELFLGANPNRAF